MKSKNIFGEDLIPCCYQPLTGFYRDGYCRTDSYDAGKHTVCAIMTKEFLEFSKAMGNDLSTPRPEYQFPGLHAGDRWCICVLRWKEAYDNNCAPKVILEATDEMALEYVEMKTLIEFADIKSN